DVCFLQRAERFSMVSHGVVTTFESYAELLVALRSRRSELLLMGFDFYPYLERLGRILD
ncbi:MAG: hypothetical protein RL033_6910, partial [Pseudomonadota bacterium]